MSEVRVRYAPSPTGIPHIGNIRTALFNYLFAKNQNGVFILRIEDTDQNRLVLGAVEKIKESLSLLSINPAEEYFQSKRIELYQKHLEVLKKANLAYEDEGAWRFKVEKGKNLKWQDLVHGDISFLSDVVEDFIIIKSDGYPTYHFASVVDDHDMQISHVFRGDEWISSTPKHLLLYETFGWNPPEFVHMPPILGHDKKKLSKRDGAKSVMEYIEEGYLPEALVNFMAFLGWAPKDNQEIFSLEQLTKAFSIERINKNSPIFNSEKLDWFNSQWIKNLKAEDITNRISDLCGKEYSQALIKRTVPLIQDRIKKLSDYKQICGFFYKTPTEFINAPPDSQKVVEHALEQLTKTDWDLENIGSSLKLIAEKSNVKIGDVAMIIRIALSGQKVTPPLNESMEILGKDEVLKRLDLYLKKS